MPKMNAYMLTILQAKQEIECPGWRIYDHNYTLRAAACGKIILLSISTAFLHSKGCSTELPLWVGLIPAM